MRTLRRFLRRLYALTSAERDEERLHAEIEQHLALQTEENLRAGMSPIEARRQAILKFGPVEAVKESYRDQSGLPALETLIQDTRHAIRRLRMSATFTLATALTLALGIGATTSIFTLVHAILLKSLPVANPGQLYRLGRKMHCCYIGGYSQDEEFSLVSYDLYKYLKDNTKGFYELAAFPGFMPLFGVRRAGSAESAQSHSGEFVSGNYFQMFGIPAYAGRMLTAQDDQPGAPPAMVLTYRFWQMYGSDPSVVGSVFYLDAKPFTVVGIAPPGFFGDTLRTTPPDFFLPLNAEPFVESDADLNKYDIHWLNLIGRIRPGASPSTIEAAMRVELKQWLKAHWGEMSAADRAKFPEQTLFLSPGGAGITGMRDQYERWLAILMMISGFVLLIVCANVANLMLVRSLERRPQTAMSIALGARGWRVLRLPLIECLLLALLGGAAGVAVAFASTRLILRFAFPAEPGFASIAIDPSPSLSVLLFALIVSLATGVIFGIAPAWMVTRVDPIEALRGANRSTVRTGSLPRKMLVVCQTALSLVLLSAAGLLSYALHNLETQPLGITLDSRYVANINPRLAGYRPAQLSLLYRRIHDAMASIPEASAVALCMYSPQAGVGWGGAVWVDGHAAPGPNDDNSAAWDRVTPDYFDVIGTPIVRGRAISQQDTAASPHVSVVNEAFAGKYFPNQDPIGRYFGREPEASREFEIVGVVKDARYVTPDPGEPVRPLFLLPEAQAEYDKGNLGSLFLHDIVIAVRPGATLSLAAVRQAMASVDPNLPVISLRTMREQVAVQLTQQSLMARLTSLFGILSLVLASIGLYGVTSYNAERRVNEVGVRMAVGADRSDVLRLIVQGAFKLVVFGLLIGIPLAFAMGRVLANQLFEVSPYNPLVVLAAIAVLGLSALPAALIPGVRASLISPSSALRVE
jgi:predicted permease